MESGGGGCRGRVSKTAETTQIGRFMNEAFCERVPLCLIYGRRSARVYGPSKRKVVAIRGSRREGASIERARLSEVPCVRLPHRVHLHLAKVSKPTAKSVKDVLCSAGEKNNMLCRFTGTGYGRHELLNRVCAPFRNVRR